MAFQINSAATAPTAVANPNWEKAAGFINIMLPSKDGKRRKIGSIPLRTSKANEKQLLEFLEADPANIETMISKLIIEYQSAQVDPSHALDL